MNYQNLYRLKFSPSFSIDEIYEKIKHSPSDWILLADITYQCIDKPDTIDTSDPRRVYVPQVLPYSMKIDDPFGRRIQHVSLQANLKTQPVMTDKSIRPDFIPFSLIAQKGNLLRAVVRCQNTQDLFLELSLVLSDQSYNVSVHPDWLATVHLHDFSHDSRNRLVKRYSPKTLEYFNYTENSVTTKPALKYQLRSMTDACRSNFTRLFNIVRGRDVLLVDQPGGDYDICQYNYITFSTNSDVSADYYFALPGAMLSSFDMSRTFAQVTLPDHNSKMVLFTPHYDPIGTFAVRQFSADIDFAPPFTNSSNNLLTSMEILASCGPNSIIVLSNNIIGDLVASGDNAESIKRQIFLTKIMEYCMASGISLKVLGDICQLN